MPDSVIFKEFAIHPVTGFMDTRSTPDEVPSNGYRWLLNIRVTQLFRMARMAGWRKHLSKDNYNNADFHDQLAGYVRENYTFLHSARTLAGFSKLFAATKTRIYALNDATENVEVIADNLGQAIESAAHLENIVIFTNNFDPPVYHSIDQPLIDGQAVADIPDLQRLKVTKVGLVVEFSNVMFYMNVVRDGVRRTNEVLWSDYKRPISLYPGPGSLANRFPLDPGDDILGALPMGDSLLIYTTHKIWEVKAVGLPQVFSFTRRYSPGQPGLRCLAYKRTLISNGDSHYYWGQDGIYKYDFYDQQPVRVDWIHRASAFIYADLNTEQCGLHVGGFNLERKEIWWSWARAGETTPSMTFVINTEFPFSNFVDHGFAAFVTHKHLTHRSLRDWILKELCICTLEELDQYGGGFVKEGGFCVPETEADCPVRPNNFWSGTSKFDTDDPTIESEDYLAPMDPGSLAGMLGALTDEEICGSEFTAGECSPLANFVMISALDNTLKEEADVFYREVTTGFTGCGTFEKRGYRSLGRSGAQALGRPSDDKLVRRFATELHPEPSSQPAQFILRIGVSTQAVDPNSASGRCVIQWEEQEPRLIECLSEVDVARHNAENTRPSPEMEWGIYQVGRYFFYEFEILNEDVTPKDTGGACSISRWTFNASMQGRPL